MTTFINDPSSSILSSISGLIQLNPHLIQLSIDSNPVPVVLRKDWSLEQSLFQIAILSGGGSGHEPAHTNYVGKGMLTGAICGNIFASPSTDLIFNTIKAVTSSKGPGCLLIVKNYTGDRLSFGLAAEKAKAIGINVQMILVGDDCAIEKDKGFQ